MSCKLSAHNSISSNGDPLQWTKCASLDTNVNMVKLAGEEAKDRLYEPKHKKKLVRVLTVIAYVFFVSLAAIMLSLYYMFLWNGDQKPPPQYVRVYSKCDNTIAEMQRQIVAPYDSERNILPPTTIDPDSSSFFDDDVYRFRLSTLMKKLSYKEYPYAEND